MVLIPKFHGYIALFVVFSVQIILTTIGVDWINDIYEDYFYITVRTIIFYIMQLVLLFTFVRTENDLFKYAVVLVISSNGANILNHFYTKIYCKVRLRKDGMEILYGANSIIICNASNGHDICFFGYNDPWIYVR